MFIDFTDFAQQAISARGIGRSVPNRCNELILLERKKVKSKESLQAVPFSPKESTGGKIARCAFLYCIGIAGTQTATVQLVDPSNQDVIWAYNVRKADASAYQSTAEAVAKHLKEFLQQKAKEKK